MTNRMSNWHIETMSNWNTKLIDAYCLATSPYRRMQLSRMQRAGTVPPMVLFYHRVADHPQNDWTISCAQFQKQIDWLQDNFEIVDLRECQRRIRSGFNDQPTVAITFDDGYAENCDFALPMLIERRIPATYFVTTYHTTEQQPFPHDRELGLPLPTNTIESLRSLDLSGIEIGGHTRTHCDLGKITCEQTLVDEVITATAEMSELIGREIRYFAFPFGQYENLNPVVFQLLKEAGFLGVCSAYQGVNEVGGDDFHIQRMHGDPVFARIKNWLTFDPRMSRTQRYEYQRENEFENVSSQSGNSIVPSIDGSAIVGTQSNSTI